MCLIAIAYQVNRDKPLVVAANRDEFYGRPTLPSHWWEEAPILAGRDLEKGGTWMELSKNGRFCALTNYREPGVEGKEKASRGHIVRSFLESEASAEVFLNNLDREKKRYPGFNVIAGTIEALWVYSSRSGSRPFRLPPGIHAISNAFLNTPWPKTVKIKQGMKESFGRKEEMFSMLQDRERAADEALPDTGVTIEWERLLSPIFIESPHYGTRCSTVLQVNSCRQAQWTERTFKSGKPFKEQSFTLDFY
ncbi:NRDE family protein [Domibacillus robiginosus]|uniref:NRDE family protein n=1 Tax=Domibacillus robiginosus TaxID=1071054 RepID=UPI00067E2AFD|nr:NRDE family protein [Domibacillus robiginosus]